MKASIPVMIALEMSTTSALEGVNLETIDSIIYESIITGFPTILQH
jgi:hypothetical protein